MALVTFKQDVHIVDNEAEVDRYFNLDDTVEVSKSELELVDAYAKKHGLKGEVYVKGAENVKENYVGPDVQSPSHPDNQKPASK